MNRKFPKHLILPCLIFLISAGCSFSENEKTEGGETVPEIVIPLTPQTPQKPGLPPLPAKKLPADNFVDIQNLISPRLFFDIRYAKSTNFTGKVIYDEENCFLESKTAAALLKAYEAAQKLEPPRTFIIYDCYRPPYAQQRLWDAFPNASYVAPPAKGSRHSRGTAVDLTLAYMDGAPVEMPTDFDVFSPLAHMNYEGKNLPPAARQNRELLKKLMTEAGFLYTRTEWWHYHMP